MNSRIGGIILLIFGLGLVLYLNNSGAFSRIGSVFSNASSSGQSASSSFSSFLSLFSPHPFATGTIVLTSGTEFVAPGGAGGATSPGGAATGTAVSQIPAYEIPSGYTAAQLSPYFQKVFLGSVGTQAITLYANGQSGDTSTVDITGWEIQTNRGGEFLPQAVNLYYPSGVNPASDIILPLDQYDSVYLYSNSAPANIRINKCMGYLNTTHDFNPPFPYSCPPVDYSQISNFTGQCQNYILSLGCNMPDLSSPYVPRTDYNCQQFLENHFSYNSCISDHFHDSDFFGSQWYVWMGSSPIDPYHDNVRLLDRNGLLVDEYRY